MKTSDIKRVIDAGLADVETTQRDVDAIMEYIHEAEARKTVRKSARGRVVKVVLVAVLLVLMFSFVAQALGLPVWNVFIDWGEESVDIYRAKNGATESDSPVYVFSEEERVTWGEELYKILETYDVFPALPRFKPEGFVLVDFFHNYEEYGYLHINAFYKNENGQVLNLIINLYTSDDYTFTNGVEYEADEEIREINIDGTVYWIVTNTRNNIVTWYDELGSYTLAGYLDMDTLEAMVRSIQRIPTTE